MKRRDLRGSISDKIGSGMALESRMYHHSLYTKHAGRLKTPYTREYYLRNHNVLHIVEEIERTRNNNYNSNKPPTKMWTTFGGKRGMTVLGAMEKLWRYGPVKVMQPRSFSNSDFLPPRLIEDAGSHSLLRIHIYNRTGGHARHHNIHNKEPHLTRSYFPSSTALQAATIQTINMHAPDAS